MNKKRKNDLDASSRAFETISGTTLQKLIKGDLISCETFAEQEQSIGFAMDVQAGIDYLSVNDYGMRGLAVRVQWGVPYNTFTIRKSRPSGVKTEYEKRTYQIENGYIYPEFTIQCYFDNKEKNNLISMAVVRTVDLYQALKTSDNIETLQSNNEFLAIHWNEIPKDKIKIWNRPNKFDLKSLRR